MFGLDSRIIPYRGQPEQEILAVMVVVESCVWASGDRLTFVDSGLRKQGRCELLFSNRV